jgi:hypothetical protein
LERDRRETAASPGAERKCARSLGENAEPRALTVEHSPHMPVSIGVELNEVVDSQRHSRAAARYRRAALQCRHLADLVAGTLLRTCVVLRP